MSSLWKIFVQHEMSATSGLLNFAENLLRSTFFNKSRKSFCASLRRFFYVTISAFKVHLIKGAPILYPKIISLSTITISKVTTQQTFLVFQVVLKMAWTHLQRNNSSKTSSRRVCKMSSKYVFKTSSRRLQEDILQTRLEEVLKSSWKTKKCYANDVF